MAANDGLWIATHQALSIQATLSDHNVIIQNKCQHKMLLQQQATIVLDWIDPLQDARAIAKNTENPS